jgi:transcriptional regulator with XRE-family HTH domain
MKREGLNINQFSRVTGMNPGTVSSMVNGNRPLSVKQLDRITEIMGHPKGQFYEQYIEEYLAEITPNWRRIKPFLYNCIRAGQVQLHPADRGFINGQFDVFHVSV